MRVVENTTIFFNENTAWQRQSGNDFFFVCFDNNIGGPFIRLLIILDSYLLYRERTKKIIHQNPEQRA